MIELGTREISAIDLGTRGISSIELGTAPVWPAGYHYTLTLKQVNYSSASNSVHASGSDYVTFTCYYRKVRSSDNTVLETNTVTASPSATYFKNTSGQLSFDVSTYYATTVSASSTKQVTLSYGSATPITATFSFSGNTKYDTASITPIILDSSVVSAGGGQVTYTGGDVTINRVWTSGYSERVTSGTAAQFSLPAYNSSVSSITGYITSYTKTATINSLTNNQTGGQTNYVFTSDAYGDNGATVSVTVHQEKNGMHQSTDYAFWDPDNNVAYSQSGINIPASPAGYIKFEIVRATVTTWDSDYPGSTTTATVYHSDYTYQAVAYSGGGCITSIGWYDSLYILQANYSANTGSNTRISGIICTITSTSETLGLVVTQEGV